MSPATGRRAEMSRPGEAAERRVSAVLFRVIRTMPAAGLTLREIRERVGDRGLLILCMVLTIPFARLERLIHPRRLPPTHGATVGRFNGILLGLTGLLMMAPLPLSLSNTLPAYGVLFLALGSVERDGYFRAVGIMGGMGASALRSYLEGIGGNGGRVIRTVFRWR